MVPPQPQSPAGGVSSGCPFGGTGSDAQYTRNLRWTVSTLAALRGWPGAWGPPRHPPLPLPQDSPLSSSHVPVPMVESTLQTSQALVWLPLASLAREWMPEGQ